MTTLAMIQARMSSTRLPGKVLADIHGHAMLARVVERVRGAKLVDQVVVVTSNKPADDPVEEFCNQNQIACFRGDENDVLDRFYRALEAHPADTLVRITADCPLIDPEVIDKIVGEFHKSNADYASNVFPPTYPDGLDCEVFRSSALKQAWNEAKLTSEREHVTPYLRNCGKFKVHNVVHDPDLSRYDHRWTVDDRADLEFVRAIYAVMHPRTDFGLDDILHLLKNRADIASIQGTAVSNEGYLKSLYQDAKPTPAPRLKLDKTEQMLERAMKVIPGCAQTFSKGYTQYVRGVAPLFLERGQGCKVWDLDGNEFIDYVQGLLPNILGYAHPEVNAAAAAQLANGHSFSLPHPLEVELAERLIRLIPCAEMVRFGKNGSDATAGAVRAARAFTGRERVACCGYHGWQDWFIGSTTRNKGVPKGVQELTHPFPYNNTAKLEEILASHPGEFAAVIMEPFNFVEPSPGYLLEVREIAHRHGALLIYDEICTGFHFGLGGAQKLFGVTPDLAAFGKAMGNGFPIACVVGRRDVMKVYEEIFFSFTFGGEVASIAATLKVLDILEHTDVLTRMAAHGKRIQDGFNTLATLAGLSKRFACVGRPNWSLVKAMDPAGNDGTVEKSLFQQESVKRGILRLATHNMTSAHTEADIEKTLKVYAEVFKVLSVWLADPDPSRFLEGPAVQPVFRVR